MINLIESLIVILCTKGYTEYTMNYNMVWGSPKSLGQIHIHNFAERLSANIMNVGFTTNSNCHPIKLLLLTHKEYDHTKV